MPVCSGPMSPRVALLSPFAFPSVRGNAVTVARVARGLRARGAELDVWDLSLRPEAAVEAEVDAFRPAVIHAFHAYRVGPLALRLARRAEIPLVVTLTGTDANHDLFDPERASVVRRVLEGASRLTVFHASIAERIAGALPDLRGRLIVVPQSAALLDTLEPFDLGAHWDLPQERVLLAFPAGIRMVKRPRFPLQPLERVVARRPSVRLLYVGPVLDADERDALHRALEGRPWARWIGPVANSVLEALALGRAVLASDIEGNRSLIEDGVTGFLFRDEAEFERRAELLASDSALRARLGAAGRDLVERRYPATREIDGYLDVYRQLVPVSA